MGLVNRILSRNSPLSLPVYAVEYVVDHQNLDRQCFSKSLGYQFHWVIFQNLIQAHTRNWRTFPS